MIIPVDAHLVALMVPAHETVTQQISGGRATRLQRVRVERTRDVPTLHLDDVADIRNLMYAGLSIPTPELTKPQIEDAQESSLAKRFTRVTAKP